MLSATDIHLLVGLLSRETNPEAVEIILGNMIYDQASQTKRDVDVTIRSKDNLGKEVAYVGIEVKDHHRKLGSIEVEQLCAKLRDMKSISQGGIVSASGYTRPAIRKAMYHGVDLYELKTWNNSKIQLSHMRFDTMDPSYMSTRDFVGEVQVAVHTKDAMLNTDHIPLADTTIVDSSVADNPVRLSGADFANAIINATKFNSPFKEEFEALSPEESKQVSFRIQYEKGLVALIDGQELQIFLVEINGTIHHKRIEMEREMKILTKIDDPSCDSGAVIHELPDGTLVCFVTSNIDRSLRLLTIPISDRNRKKINQIRLGMISDISDE